MENHTSKKVVYIKGPPFFHTQTLIYQLPLSFGLFLPSKICDKIIITKFWNFLFPYMVDLNWLFVLLGFGVKGAPNMSDDNTKAWNQILLLTIVLAIWWLLCHLAEDRETNPIVNEVDDELGEILEHPNGELDHYFDEDGHHRAAEPGGDANGRHGGCSICGNFSTTRCASCKAARYW